MQDRNNLKAQGLSTGGLDYKIRQGVENLKSDANNLDKQVYAYFHETTKYADMPNKEKNKRQDQIKLFKERVEQTVAVTRQTFEGASSSDALFGGA